MINKLWAVLSTENDVEGIMAAGSSGYMMPLITGSKEIFDKHFKKIALQAMQEKPGVKIALAEFSSREDLETYG